jgi:hypothetical protein
MQPADCPPEQAALALQAAKLFGDGAGYIVNKLEEACRNELDELQVHCSPAHWLLAVILHQSL